MKQSITHKIVTLPQKRSLTARAKAGLKACALLGLGSICFSIPVTAQTAPSTLERSPLSVVVGQTDSFDGLNLNLEQNDGLNFVGLSPTLRRAVTELPTDTTRLFNLDESDIGCFEADSICLTEGRDINRLDLAYSKPNFLSLNDKGLGLELTPSASVHLNDDSQSAVVGALLRIGDGLDESTRLNKNTWYFFAGADAEAVNFRPNGTSQLTRGNFNLQDRVFVGDAQAGLGYRIGDADLSLSYIHREVSGFDNIATDSSFTEDAAAFSFTWRR